MFDLKGHHREVGSCHFRFTNGDLRSRIPDRVNRKSYLANFRPLRLRVNQSFTNQKTSQSVQKIGKVMQGKASVLTPSPRVPPSLAPTATRPSHKTLCFQPIYPYSNPSIHVIFTPKITRFMAYWQSAIIIQNERPISGGTGNLPAALLQRFNPSTFPPNI